MRFDTTLSEAFALFLPGYSIHLVALMFAPMFYESSELQIPSSRRVSRARPAVRLSPSFTLHPTSHPAARQEGVPEMARRMLLTVRNMTHAFQADTSPRHHGYVCESLPPEETRP